MVAEENFISAKKEMIGQMPNNVKMRPKNICNKMLRYNTTVTNNRC